MVSRSKDCLFWRVTWASDVICLCREARDAVVDSKAVCSLVFKSSMAHRECPSAPPERPRLVADVERESPIKIGRKAARLVLVWGSSHSISALLYRVNWGTRVTGRHGKVEFRNIEVTRVLLH